MGRGQRGLQEWGEHWEAQISTYTHPHPHMCTQHTHTHTCTHTHTHTKLWALCLTAETQPGQGPTHRKGYKHERAHEDQADGPSSAPVTGWQAGAWPSHTLQN